MAVLRENDLADFLKKKSAGFNGLLFYGNDDAAISTALRQVVASMSAGEEPLRMEMSALRNDPACLDDAFRSLSLLGDRRLIVLSGVEENHLAAVQSVLSERALGNFVVMVAGALKKGSKFRDMADANPVFASVGFYEETGMGVLVMRAQMIVKQHGMNFAEGAAERFVALCGGDRSVLLNEAEKLALYCHPEKLITREDVDAICGDQAEFESDALLQAVFDGEVETADRIFASMTLSGDAKSVLIMAQMYLARLEAVSAAMARGLDLSSACRAARPPIFDKQQAAAGRQLRVLSGDDLGRAQVAVQFAILQSRQMADLGDAITARCLLSLARMARQARAKAA
jgi:DNA polymerase III subunit delta